jgi:hypothetical protein
MVSLCQQPVRKWILLPRVVNLKNSCEELTRVSEPEGGYSSHSQAVAPEEKRLRRIFLMKVKD